MIIASTHFSRPIHQSNGEERNPSLSSPSINSPTRRSPKNPLAVFLALPSAACPLFNRRESFSINFSSMEEVAVETAAVPIIGEPMDIMSALQLVLKKSLAHDGLVRGLHEGAKAIEKHAAQLCVLAEDCDQPDYVKLVKALCTDHNVNMVTVPSAKTLGEWSGLCKIDSEGKARKVVGCSCVVVKDYGEESEGLNIVQGYVKPE